MHSICSLVKHCEGLKNIRQPLFSSRKQGIWRDEAYNSVTEKLHICLKVPG